MPQYRGLAVYGDLMAISRGQACRICGMAAG